ncbi:MAG: peptidoglycan editing factor PgeF [Betaproteobacteria bacterium]|nr:peptidoglycan editing factor PgeF [Betaproteobacteria bacterium]
MQIQDWQLPLGVQALCTTRLGGVSLPPFDSLNLGDHVQDEPHHVTQNRDILKEKLQGARPVFLKQVHGSAVLNLEPLTPDGALADACFTQTPYLACTIMVADCLPILFTDFKGAIVAAAHAGWRGLAHGVVENTVNTMCLKSGVHPSDILVWLGPCIGPNAFEVGSEVLQAFLQADKTARRCFKKHPDAPGKYFADLPMLARERLRALGVLSIAGNDSSDAWCTVQQASRFFSYRRDGVTGRFAACIWRNA